MAILMICALCTAGITSAQSKANKTAAEPTGFSEEGDQFNNTVPIPDNVMDALHNSEEAKSMKDVLENMGRDKFAQLFKAIVVHLRGPKETDYILLSEYPLNSADASWFWIVRFDPVHPKVIFCASANSFEILKTRNNGYPNIRSYTSIGGIEYIYIFHYDGREYILTHKYQKEYEQ
jgi:hypothetical protein